MKAHANLDVDMREALTEPGYRRVMLATLWVPAWEQRRAYALLAAYEGHGEHASYVLRTSASAPPYGRESDELASRSSSSVRKSARLSVDTATGRRLEAQLGNLRLPLVAADPPGGFDGCTIGVEVGEGQCGARLWWWTSAPAEWAALEAIAEEIMRLADGEQGAAGA